jgi:hypothetical protein
MLLYLESSTECPCVVVAFHSFGDCRFIHIFTQQEIDDKNHYTHDPST